MTRSKGKLVARTAVVVGIFTLGATGLAFRGWVVEKHYIHKLESKDPTEVETAAKKLGEMRSVRAVPALLEVWIRTCQEAEARDSRAGIAIGGRVLAAAKREGVVINVPVFTLEAIGKIGRQALPLLLKTFDKGGPWRGAAYTGLSMIGKSEGMQGDVEEFLVQVAKDSTPGSALHRAVTDLLPKVRGYAREPLIIIPSHP